jgi:hypothetical protein
VQGLRAGEVSFEIPTLFVAPATGVRPVSYFFGGDWGSQVDAYSA